jgi:hypothetical protein
VRKVSVLSGALVLGLVGAVLAARQPPDALPVEPPKPRAVIGPADAGARPAAEPNKENPAVAFTTAPKLWAATDVTIRSVRTVAWSRDGLFFAVEGVRGDPQNQQWASFVFAIHEKEFHTLALGGANTRGDLVGFAPIGRALLTAKREYDLVSGFHWLRYESLPEDIEQAIKVGYTPKVRTVDLDPNETREYAFAPDGKTFRTVGIVREPSGTATKLDVLEVDAVTGKPVKSLLKVESGAYALSDNGKRFATANQEFTKVTVYDVDRGAKVSEYALTGPPLAELPQIEPQWRTGKQDQEHPVLMLSPDGHTLLVSRSVGQNVLVNAETGEALPELAGLKDVRVSAEPHAFSADGRLFAAPGVIYKPRTVTTRPGGFEKPKEVTVWTTGPSFLAVWDTRTGKALKTWNRPARVLFHPTQPMIAILEQNVDNTRIGLWNFSAEAEKK